MKAVKFDHYGSIDVLKVEEVAKPEPGMGQVLIKVKAAGINPGEAAIRKGVFATQWPAKFPSGEGSDFAGVVEKIGEDVTKMAVGDEVIGFTQKRASHAEYVVVDEGNLIHRPQHVPWEVAGGLFVAGTTAYAAVRAVSLQEGDTVVIAGAAGGVGSIAIQLAKNAGARVIGIASEANHDWLKKYGVIPVVYDDAMAQKVRDAAGKRVDAFIDAHGDGYVDLAINLGVSPKRINTIIDFEAAKKYGVKTEGNQEAAQPGILAELAKMIDDGRLEIPIAKVYHLAEVREAYKELEKHHTHGKIVLVP